jgi:uncharacterized protein YqjF (DUF2071 family)
MSAPLADVAPGASAMVHYPRRGWLWAQNWYDLFFAHWRVPAATLQGHLPADLEVETWEGTAWVSVVAFRLDVRRRWLPSLGAGMRFVELNLRTYVRHGGDRGIYFLSIHAGTRLAVALARWLTPLPYAFAPIGYERNGAGWRFECGWPGADRPLFQADFTPLGPVTAAADSALDAWLLERYRAFTTDRNGRLWGMLARHEPWSIRRVTADVSANNLGMPWGLGLRGPPDVLHFAPSMEARLWPFAGGRRG